VGDVESEQWSAMLLESTAAKFAELKGWDAMWQVVNSEAGSDVLLMAQGFFADTGSVLTLLETEDSAEDLLSEHGALGLLAMVAASGDVATAYSRMKTHGVLEDLIDDLPEGEALGGPGKLNLRPLFMRACINGHLEEAQDMWEVRFDTDLSTEDDMSWTPESVRRLWEILEVLPPSAVESNDDLDTLLRYDKGAGIGEYRGDVRDKVAIGFGEDLDEEGDQGGPLGGGLNAFNHVLRHEIGHAVDAAIGASSPGGYVTSSADAGQWITYGGEGSWTDAVIAAGGGFSQYGEHADAYREAFEKALDDEISFPAALQALKDDEDIPDTTPDPGAAAAGPVAAVYALNRWRSDDRPWYRAENRPAVGTRHFQEAYSGEWVSYVAATRSSKAITDYQWRAPGEWFAEIYSFYYMDYETGAATGSTLRGNGNASVVNWFDRAVDQGYSLAQRTGQGGGP